MSLQALPSPRALTSALPLTPQGKAHITRARSVIVDIMQHRDPRLLLVVGPCSVHDVGAAWEYACRLKALSDSVQDVFFIVMRTYFEKPRTILGWKGLLYDPNLDGSHAMEDGLYAGRSFLHNLAAIELPAACEFLDPLASEYIADLVSWGCIGSRTCESQIHRQLAAALPMPVGIKNSTCGSLKTVVQSLIAAQGAHHFFGIDQDGRIAARSTPGNPHVHMVMRGGMEAPNYTIDAIEQAGMLLKEAHLPPSILVDCAHDNCRDSYQQQAEIFTYLISHVMRGISLIRGIMFESFLSGGRQESAEPLAHGRSLTDPCLDWLTTEQSILDAARLLRKALILT